MCFEGDNWWVTCTDLIWPSGQIMFAKWLPLANHTMQWKMVKMYSRALKNDIPKLFESHSYLNGETVDKNLPLVKCL